jgi:hypothetical protein
MADFRPYRRDDGAAKDGYLTGRGIALDEAPASRPHPCSDAGGFERVRPESVWRIGRRQIDCCSIDLGSHAIKLDWGHRSIR